MSLKIWEIRLSENFNHNRCYDVDNVLYSSNKYVNFCGATVVSNYTTRVVSSSSCYLKCNLRASGIYAIGRIRKSNLSSGILGCVRFDILLSVWNSACNNSWHFYILFWENDFLKYPFFSYSAREVCLFCSYYVINFVN